MDGLGAYPEGSGEAPGSSTSRAAAKAVQKNKPTREKIVYEALRVKPRTRWELVDDLGWPYESVNPRCSEMKARGVLRATGATRVGHHGVDAEVLEVAAPYTPKAPARPGPPAPDDRFEISVAVVDKLKTALAHLQLSMCGHAMKAETILKEVLPKI